MPLSTLPPIPTVASPETKKKLRRSLLQETIDEVYGSMEALTPEAKQRVERYFPLHEVSERVRRGLSPLAPTGARQFPPEASEPRVAAPQEAKPDALTQLVRETRARRQGGRELGTPASQYTPMGTPLTPETPPALGLVQSAVDILGTAGLKGGGFGGGAAVRNVQARSGYRPVPQRVKHRGFDSPYSLTSGSAEYLEGKPAPVGTLPTGPVMDPFAGSPESKRQEEFSGFITSKGAWFTPEPLPPELPSYPDRPASWDPQSKYAQALYKWHQKQEQPGAFDWLNDLPYAPATRSLTKEYKEAKEQEGQLPLPQEFQPEQFMKRPERTGRFANIELDLPPPEVKWPKMYAKSRGPELGADEPASSAYLPEAIRYAEELGRDPKELFTIKKPPGPILKEIVGYLKKAWDERETPYGRGYLKGWRGEGGRAPDKELDAALLEEGLGELITALKPPQEAAQEPSKRAIDLDLSTTSWTPNEEAWARRLNAMRDTSKLINEYLPKQPRGVKWEEIAAILRTTQETPEVKAARAWYGAKFGGRADMDVGGTRDETEATKQLYKQETGKDWPIKITTPNINAAIDYFKARYPRQFDLAEKVQPAEQDVINVLAGRPAFDTSVLGVTTQTGQRGSALHGQLGMAAGLSPEARQVMGAITNKPSVMISQQAHEGLYGALRGRAAEVGKRRLALETVGHEIGGHVVDWARAAKGLAGKKRLSKEPIFALPGAERPTGEYQGAKLIDSIEARAERQGMQVASRQERVKALIPELAVNDPRQPMPTAAEQAAYDKGVKTPTVVKFTNRTGLGYLEASEILRGQGIQYKHQPKIAEAILRRAAAEAVLKQLIKEGKSQGKSRMIEPLEPGEAPDKSVLPDYSKLVFEELGAETKRGVEEQMREETERRKGMYYGKVPWTQEEADAIMLKMFGKYGKKR